MTTLLDGKKISDASIDRTRKSIGSSKLQLAIILVGDNPSSQTYVKMKQKKCQEIGISTELFEFKKDASKSVILDKISELNKRKNVTGILIQLPLPKKFESDTQKILDAIIPEKDVDGLSTYWLGKNLVGDETIVSCTPKGVIRLLDEYKISLEGKNVCIVGTSNLVGKPLGLLCINRFATVTYTNIHTINLKEHTLRSDIIMSATGSPHLIKADMIKNDAVVIDIGFSKVDNNIVGDIDFDNVSRKTSYITPVPGGVGPMTIAMLIENLTILSKWRKK